MPNAVQFLSSVSLKSGDHFPFSGTMSPLQLHVAANGGNLYSELHVYSYSRFCRQSAPWQ